MGEIDVNPDFCCTCLKVDSDQGEIFLRLSYAPMEDISYTNKLKTCIPEMRLGNTDDYLLCQPCSIALENAYNFRCMCLQNENKLEEFILSRNRKLEAVQKHIKKELIEQSPPEEMIIEPEELNLPPEELNLEPEELILEPEELNLKPEAKFQVNAQPSDDFSEDCSAQPEEYSMNICIETEGDIGGDSVNSVDSEDVIEIEEVPTVSEKHYTKDRETKIETVKDQLGSLLNESLGNKLLDINISVFDKGTKNSSEITSEINIFNSLNAEIEELRKNTTCRQLEVPKINLVHEVKPDIKEIKNIKIKSEVTQVKSSLTDDEIVALACKTIPDLYNHTVDSLHCRVALEKITVTELPVKIPGASIKNSSSRKRAFRGVLKSTTYRQTKFWCNVCKKNLSRKDRYNSHILRHSNIRAYKCKACKQGFFSSETLNKHQKTHCEVLAKNNTATSPISAESSTSSTNKVVSKVEPAKTKTAPPVVSVKKKKMVKVKKTIQRKAAKIKAPIKTESPFKYKSGHNAFVTRRSQRKQVVPKRLLDLNDEIYRCELCNYSAYKRQKIQVHMLKHTNDKPFKCEICPNRKYFEKWELNRHMRNNHLGEVEGRVVSRARRFKSKILTQKNKVNNVKIKVENEEIENEYEPTAAEPAITLSVNQTNIVTPIIQSIESLAPSTVQEEVIEMSFSCKKCNISFKSRNLLILHTQTHEWKHRCTLCNQQFLSERELFDHAETHMNLPQDTKPKDTKPILAETAASSKKSPQLEQPPKLKPKKKKKKFFCTICDMEFASRDHGNIHTGAKPYPCKVCGKQFAAYSTLRKHKLTHQDGASSAQASGRSKPTTTQRKKYVCEFCKKEFINKEYVYSHNCHNASGESVYRCQICKNTFIGRTALIEHMGVHVTQSSN